MAGNSTSQSAALPADTGERRPVALLFDWDNTLADTWPAIHHALAATFRAMGREPWTFEETRARVRASARDSFPALFGAQAEEAMEVFYGTFAADHLAQLRERPGAGPPAASAIRTGAEAGLSRSASFAPTRRLNSRVQSSASAS